VTDRELDKTGKVTREAVRIRKSNNKNQDEEDTNDIGDNLLTDCRNWKQVLMNISDWRSKH